MKKGSIEVICGSMFSGKSEELIRRVKRELFANRFVQVFKPKLDNRYSEEEVVSHNGNRVKAIPIENIKETLKFIDPLTSVIGFDEAQFFSGDLIDVATRLANERGMRVIIAGLDQDFRGEPFGPMPNLLAIADAVTKLQAVCMRCGGNATKTQRLINGEPASYYDPVVLVGATEHYEARCRSCHEVKHVIKHEKVTSI